MNKTVIKIERYWDVYVFFNIDYHMFWLVADDLKSIGCSDAEIKRVRWNMTHGAKAFTISHPKMHVSVMGFNYNPDKYDMINTFVHEAEHAKQAMLWDYEIKDAGEPPAYTVGYLTSRLMMEYDYFTDIRPGRIIG